MISFEITRLIPQREPILMVDRLERVEGDSAGTLFCIREDNFFLEADGRLAEIGVIWDKRENCLFHACLINDNDCIRAGFTN